MAKEVFKRTKPHVNVGDEVEIELVTPIAMEQELRFAIREGGKTVGAGVVTKIIN